MVRTASIIRAMIHRPDDGSSANFDFPTEFA
jgi:hypothetical protein